MSDMFNLFGKKEENPQFQNNVNSMSDLVDKFNSFKRGFTGNPEQKLQELLSSGQMTKEQYNNLCELAKKLIGK